MHLLSLHIRGGWNLLALVPVDHDHFSPYLPGCYLHPRVPGWRAPSPQSAVVLPSCLPLTASRYHHTRLQIRSSSPPPPPRRWLLPAPTIPRCSVRDAQSFSTKLEITLVTCPLTSVLCALLRALEAAVAMPSLVALPRSRCVVSCGSAYVVSTSRPF